MLKKVFLRVQYLESIIFLILLSPMIISWQRIIPEWDDTFYLHNGVCVARSFWDANPTAIDTCLSQMVKSPIMAMLEIPAGPFSSELESLSVAPFVLSLLIGAFVLFLNRTLRRAKVPFVASLIAAAAAIATPALWTNGAPFMVDGLLAVVVACTVALVFAEYEDASQTTWDAVASSASWAVLITVGMLSKTTYAAIVVLLIPMAVWISYRRSGLRITLIKVVASVIFLLPLIAILVRYGPLYLAWAKTASFGPVSAFYNDGLSPFKFIVDNSIVNWPIWLGILVLAIFAIVRGLERERVVIGLLTVLVILIYLLIASTSPNKDPRFFWLVWLTLPFCVAGMVSPRSAAPDRKQVAPIIQLVCALLIAIPAIARLDLVDLRRGVETLNALPGDTSETVMLMTDSAHFNIETLTLAKQLDWRHRSKMQIGTVVYDIVNENTPQKSLERLANADYVIGQFPVKDDAPEWTNRNAPIFEQALRASKRNVITVGNDHTVLIYAK